MFVKRWTLIAVAVLLPLIAACSDESNERQRSVIEIASVAEGGVFVAATWDAGSDKEFPTTDDFQPAGHVPITLRNRSYNEFITAPDLSPYGNFHVTEVSIEWYALDGTTPVDRLTPFNYTAQYDLVVPKDTEVTFNVMTAPFSMKQDQYFLDLALGHGGNGSTRPFAANAKITIRGHDSGDERSVEIEGGILVEFIGVIVKE